MMSITEIQHLFKSAFLDFRRDKVRTALTSLGIMIGVLSVVMLIALGLGLKNYIQKQFQDLGASLIMIMPGSGFSEGFGAGMMGGIEFDERDLKSLTRVSDAKYVVPLVFKSTNIESADKSKVGYIMGVNEEYFSLMNQKPEFGTLWEKSEVGKKAKVIVLGNSIADELFEKPEDALGKTIRIGGLRLKVVAINKKTGDREQDNSAIMPYTTTYGSLNPDKKFWSIYMGVTDEAKVESVKKEAEEILLKRYDDDKFSVTEQSEILNTVNQIFGILNLVLMAIGSISLLVGGIGIMNIMYATVTERTREVGIRRAVGATRRDILLQFLTESTILSLFGGTAGLILATLIVLLVRIWFPAALNLVAVLVAFGVSSAIGIFFGVFPARKAADLSPIEAIRYE